MPDPSILVTLHSLDDPSLAPPGCSTLYVLEPVPNLDGRVDWTRGASGAVDRLRGQVAAAGYPTDVVDRGGLRPARLGGAWAWSGARRSPSPTRSARPARSGRATSTGGCPGLVFVGSSTVPGVGVPMVLVSGKLAAARVADAGRDGRAMTRHARGELRRVPAAQQAPRHDLLLVDDGAADGEAPPRPRAVRVLPLRRRHRRRPRADDGRRSRPSGARSTDFGDRFFADLDAGRSDDPVLKAVVHTVRAFDIDPEASAGSCARWTMDLTVERYET